MNFLVLVLSSLSKQSIMVLSSSGLSKTTANTINPQMMSTVNKMARRVRKISPVYWAITIIEMAWVNFELNDCIKLEKASFWFLVALLKAITEKRRQ